MADPSGSGRELAPLEDGGSALAIRAPAAAQAAGLRTALAGVVVAGHLPFWLQGAFFRLLDGLQAMGLSGGGALSFGNGILVLGAVILTRLVAKAVAPVVRQATARSPVEGRAAAAGACMAAAALSAVGIGIAHLLDLSTFGSSAFWLLLLRLGGAALGVGLFGSQLFREVGDEEQLGPVPPLYAFLSWAGITTALGLFVLGVAGLAPSGPGAMACLGISSLAVGAMALGVRRPRAAELPDRT